MVGTRTDLVQVLAVRDFRRLLRVRMVGQAGDGVFQTTLFAAVFFNPQDATSAAQAAAAFAVVLLPYSLLGPFAGVLLDRWSRQRVLVLGNLARALLVLVFAGALGTVAATSPLVQGLALITISLSRFLLSGLSAAQPHVVEESRLVVGNSVSTTLGGASTLVGGAFAVGVGPLVGGAGSAGIAVAGAGLYVAAGLLASRMPYALLGPDHPPAMALRHALDEVLRGVLAGARHVRQRGEAFRGLCAIGAHRFFFGLSFVTTLLLYTPEGDVGRGVRGLAAIIVATGAGGLVAAGLTPGVVRRVGPAPWIVGLFVVAAAVQTVLGLTFSHLPLVIAAFVLGLAAQGAKITVDTLLQLQVDDDFRGRVFSFYDTAFNVTFVSAGAAAAFLLPDDGRSVLVIALIGGGYLLTAIGYGLASARARDRGHSGPLRSSDELQPGRHPHPLGGRDS